MTFKQLEALYWIGELGSFALAAQKLHTSQSAVSKRVQELETVFDTALFDRTLRSARLTDKGEEMFMLAKNLLDQRNAAIEQFSRVDVIERRVRIGVTELTAMTWLPRWVELIQVHYPKVTLEPDVDSSVNLREKVLTDELDLIIVPDAFSDTRIPTKAIGRVESAWMCKPGLVEVGKPMRLHELAAPSAAAPGREIRHGPALRQLDEGPGRPALQAHRHPQLGGADRTHDLRPRGELPARDAVSQMLKDGSLVEIDVRRRCLP